MSVPMTMTVTVSLYHLWRFLRDICLGLLPQCVLVRLQHEWIVNLRVISDSVLLEHHLFLVHDVYIGWEILFIDYHFSFSLILFIIYNLNILNLREILIRLFALFFVNTKVFTNIL